MIDSHPRLELFNRPGEGAAVIGYTSWRGRRLLKLTVLNPCASEDDLAGLLETIAAHGRALEREN